MKKKLLILSLIVACLAIIASGTLAYFTAEDTAHNVITSGGVDITLEEWAEDPDGGETLIPFENVTGVMPGAEVSKIVTVKNTGASDAWIRVKADVSITLAEGVTGEVDLSLLKIDYNTEFWTLNEDDGYWYYNTYTKPGEVTEPLFTTVTFDVSMGNLYQNSSASVDVSAQAVQTANNGETVMEAQGWPAE